MAATAQILIEVDDTGAVTAFKAIGDAGAKIGPSLQSAKPALDTVAKGANNARESAALLSEEFGVKMPRALRGVLAEAPGVGAALNAAFTGLAVAGFIELVKTAVDNLTGFTVALDAIKKQNDELFASVSQANKTLIGPLNLSQVRDEIGKTTKAVADMEKQLGLSGDGGFSDTLTRGMTRWSAANSIVLESLDKEKTHLNDLYVEQAKLVDEQRRTEPIEILKQQNAAREAGLTGLKAITTAYEDQIKVIQKEIALDTQSVADHRAQYAEIAALKKKESADVVRYFESVDDTSKSLAQQAWQAWKSGTELIKEQQKNAIDNQETLLRRGLIDQQVFEDRKKSIISASDAQMYKLQIQEANEIAQADSQAAVATIAPWARAYAQISADTQQRLREIQQQLDETRISSTQAAQLAADAWAVNFARTRDQLATDMESFFDDLTSGNIGKRFKKMFEDLVFQMVATWLLGMQSMRSAASTGFGGGPGGILGALFGLGGLGGSSGGIGPGGTPPFLASLFGGGSGTAGGGVGALPTGLSPDLISLVPGLGLSAGAGSTPGGVLPSGASTGAAAAGLSGLLAKIFPNGLSIGGLSISGSMLAAGGLALALNGIGRGGVLGALEGAGGGALTGFAIGGPLGAAIGAAIGLFASIIGGLFGPHKGDIARTQVMEPLLSSIKQVTDSYDVFQTDYNTGISELETLRTNALAALKKIGGRQVRGNSTATNQHIDAAEKHLKDTEAERQRRSQTNFGTPQFHSGGLVRGGTPAVAGRPQFHAGGEVNANLLIGEGVVNRRGMNILGEAGLNALNGGSEAGGGVTINLTVQAIDTKGFDVYLRDGGFRSIAIAAKRAWREGMRT